MKGLFVRLLLPMMTILSACSSKSHPSALSGNSQEEKAVHYVRLHLEKKTELQSYKVVNGDFPIVLMSDEFKPYRDAVYKAQLDYRTNHVRGLQVGMDKAVATLLQCQNEIKNQVENFRQSHADGDYITVLATLRDNNMSHQTEYNLIVVFDSQTLNMEKWETITTPIQNNAILMTGALNGTLLTEGIGMNQNLDSLAATVTDPVIKFILQSVPR